MEETLKCCNAKMLKFKWLINLEFQKYFKYQRFLSLALKNLATQWAKVNQFLRVNSQGDFRKGLAAVLPRS